MTSRGKLIFTILFLGLVALWRLEVVVEAAARRRARRSGGTDALHEQLR
jgi:hypothetical protein